MSWLSLQNQSEIEQCPMETLGTSRFLNGFDRTDQQRESKFSMELASPLGQSVRYSSMGNFSFREQTGNGAPSSQRFKVKRGSGAKRPRPNRISSTAPTPMRGLSISATNTFGLGAPGYEGAEYDLRSYLHRSGLR